jgi:hypothetical protein
MKQILNQLFIPAALYKAFGSKKITGFGSHIAANNKPFACFGPLGMHI